MKGRRGAQGTVDEGTRSGRSSDQLSDRRLVVGAARHSGSTPATHAGDGGHHHTRHFNRHPPAANRPTMLLDASKASIRTADKGKNCGWWIVMEAVRDGGAQGERMSSQVMMMVIAVDHQIDGGGHGPRS